ncbi:MAG: response regulator [Proteobacteria bacterium]|nr:response regulator [Pseudomonadota bacterium]
MTTLILTSGLFTHADQTAKKLSESMGLTIVTDTEIMEETSARHQIKMNTLAKVIESKTLAFNDFTHEKEKCLACLKKTIAGHTEKGNCIFHGILGHLIPEWVSHAMRVLIISDKKTRIAGGMKELGLSQKEATSKVNQADKRAIIWTNALFGKKSWDESLYDMVIPSDKTDSAQSVRLITEHLKRLDEIPVDVQTQESRDLQLCADVDIALSDSASGLEVEVKNGNVTITIEKNVLMLSMFKQKITRIAQAVPGVRSVDTKIGKNYYKTDIIHNFDFETPLNVLLVDDEKEFVQTLSERLKMRQVKSDVVFNGKDALEFADREATEVMVLDLKMPGIDGFEVLKQIKATKPHIEVIILTGHGSEDDKKTCMDLGAFAYLQKPADIDILTDTMRKAYEKINLKKTAPAV